MVTPNAPTRNAAAPTTRTPTLSAPSSTRAATSTTAQASPVPTNSRPNSGPRITRLTVCMNAAFEAGGSRRSAGRTATSNARNRPATSPQPTTATAVATSVSELVMAANTDPPDTGAVPELAVAVLGPDRPGVIAALSGVLLAGAGNLEDVSMTILRGQFAMTLVVDLPSPAEAVAADLARVAERLGLLISVRDAPAAQPAPAGEPFVVTVHGADRPGIVHAVTAAVAVAGGNITDLSTRLV